MAELGRERLGNAVTASFPRRQRATGRQARPANALISSAPAHSQLTFYHENNPGNPLSYPKSISNATTAVEIQRYGQRLCAGSRVRFGVIIVGPAVANWIAPHLDWYGVDQYLFGTRYLTNGKLDPRKLYKHLDKDLAVFKHKSGLRHPQVCFPGNKRTPSALPGGLVHRASSLGHRAQLPSHPVVLGRPARRRW